MKKTKKVVKYLLICVLILSDTYYVPASTSIVKPKVVVSENTSFSEGYSTYSSDVIVYKYRRLGNKLQYRRWNRTKEVWVDPDWIDV
ncbi:MAG: hypothetical protein ACI4TF_08760 [Oliverpabstia sp.]